jgi:SAM-dependent methyltransferase
VIDLSLTDQDISAAIAPYVTERLDAADPRWREIVRETKRRHEAKSRRRAAAVPLSAPEEVERRYTRHWSRGLEELWVPRVMPFEWRQEGFLMHSIARRRLSHLLLGRALRAVGARSILEVGCGTGFHLFLLAAQRPELELTGAELTPSGVAAAAEVRRGASLPDIITGFAAEPIRAAAAHQRVRIARASAAALPFADGSFDAVCTVLALEQMEAIRERAFAELRRVTRRWVVMIEPFRDLNDEGLRLDYVRAMNYLGERIDGLQRHGLVPRAVYRDLPNKITYHVALVVAERAA